MAMLNTKDKPTYYQIVTESGDVIATAPKSKVMQLKKKLQAERGEKLSIQLEC